MLDSHQPLPTLSDLYSHFCSSNLLTLTIQALFQLIAHPPSHCPSITNGIVWSAEFHQFCPKSLSLKWFVEDLGKLQHQGNIRKCHHIGLFHQSSVWCTIWESHTQKTAFYHGNHDASQIQLETSLYLLQKQCISLNSFTIHNSHSKVIINTGRSTKFHHLFVIKDWSPHQSCFGQTSALYWPETLYLGLLCGCCHLLNQHPYLLY